MERTILRLLEPERYDEMIELVPVGLYRNNTKGECIYINQKTSELLDITLEECLGLGWVSRLYPDDLEQVQRSWSQAFATKSFWQDEYRFLRRDQSIVWVLARCVFTFDAQGNNTGSVGCLTDITDKKNLEVSLKLVNKKLKQLANKDGLTEIYNRRYFDEFLSEQWLRLSEEKKFLSLILVDIDCFKLYNDRYGHLLGDEILKIVAKLLSHQVEPYQGFAARYGGEEFALILPKVEQETAKIIAHQIIFTLRQLAIPHQGTVLGNYLTLSMGIASLVPQAHLPPTLLISQADQALYLAKAQGRDRLVVYAEIA